MEKTIGPRKYEALKALNLHEISEDSISALNLQFPQLTVGEAVKMIDTYEKKFAPITAETKKAVSDYFEKINQEPVKREIKEMTKDWLWERFDKNFKSQEGTKYSRSADSLENIKPLIYYFIGDFDNFKKCKNVSMLSQPSMDKGLLIIGGYGNGKTSVMKALRKSLVGTNIPFRMCSTNELVTWYEECKDAEAKAEFNQKTMSKIVYFDDVLTEREASNYGKSNLMKDILEQRYDRGLRTYITCNLKDGSSKVEDGLAQFGVKYGSRVYDRLFAMFNIVEFKGKSYRV